MTFNEYWNGNINISNTASRRLSRLFVMQANSTVFHQSTVNSTRTVLRTCQGLDPRGQGQRLTSLEVKCLKIITSQLYELFQTQSIYKSFCVSSSWHWHVDLILANEMTELGIGWIANVSENFVSAKRSLLFTPISLFHQLHTKSTCHHISRLIGRVYFGELIYLISIV